LAKALNALPDLLDAHGAPKGARVLDIGGSAYDGEESVHFLLDLAEGPVDVVLQKPEHGEAMRERFGDRIRILDSEGEAEAGAYDVVVANPTLGKLTETLLDAGWRARRLLKPGGLFFSFGLDPRVLGAEGFKQPDREVSRAFREAFVEGDAVTGVPEALGRVFEFVVNTPRKPAFRSFLTWFVLRLREDAPEPERPVLFADPAAAFVIDGFDGGVDDGTLDAALVGQAPDVLMVVDNPVIGDGRVMKTVDTVIGLGKRVLCLGLNREARFAAASLPNGAVVLQFPNPRIEVDRRLRAAGVPLDPGVRHELRMAVFARLFARVLKRLKRPGLVVHSHDFQPLYAVGSVLEPIRREQPFAGIRWIHDIHEYVADYGLIEPSVAAVGTAWERHYLRLADRLTGVSEEQCEKVAAFYGVPTPTVIYNTQRMGSRERFRGRTVRQRLGLTGRVMIHSGSVRPGRGVEQVVRILPELPDTHLVLLTGSKSEFVDGLVAEANELGVGGRLFIHPAIPFDQVPGAISDADLGLISTERYGNAEVSLPNKLFDYMFAGIPVVATPTDSLARFFREWPMGALIPSQDEAGMLAAVREVLDNRARYATAITARPDLLIHYAWESQAVKLKQIYDAVAQMRPGAVAVA